MLTKYKIIKDKNIAFKKHDEIIKNLRSLIIYTNNNVINNKVKAIIITLNLRIKKNLLIRNDIKVIIYAVKLYNLILIIFIAA